MRKVRIPSGEPFECQRRPGAGLSVVDDHREAGIADQLELLATQFEVAEIRVTDETTATAAPADVMACPEPSEQLALDRQLADECLKARVINISANFDTQLGDHTGRVTLPVRVILLCRGVEEDRAQAVRPSPHQGRQSLSKGIGSEHVAIAIDDERRHVEGVQQQNDADRNPLELDVRGARGAVSRDLVQIGTTLGVELKDACEGIEYLGRGTPIAATLQAQVILRTDPGQQSYLFAPQARHAA